MTDSINNNLLPKAIEKTEENGDKWHECPGCTSPDETSGPKGYVGKVFKCHMCQIRYEVVNG